MVQERKSLVTKPEWLITFEQRVGASVRFHPNVLSALKLLLVTPLILLSLKQVDTFPHSSILTLSLFLLFCFLDYMDGIVARVQNRETHFGRIFDRMTDYPLLFIVAWFAVDLVPLSMLIAKILLDVILFIQFLLKKGTTENRIRTTLSYITLLGMLMLGQNWAHSFITEKTVMALLALNITFSAIVVLFNLGVIQKRFIADAISAGNLTCGIFSMYFASLGRFEVSLLLLMIGGVLDGFDGAAARRWGGTRIGVYSDDIADGVNYGIAPGVALYFAFPGFEGLTIGIIYSAFTIARLIYFTMNIGQSDPEYFKGVPSTAGGLMVMCGLVLWQSSPLLLGLITGIAITLMISFDAAYKHLGRAFASKKKRYIIGVPTYGFSLILLSFLWGIQTSVALLLLVIVVYGFSPAIKHLYQLKQKSSIQ